MKFRILFAISTFYFSSNLAFSQTRALSVQQAVQFAMENSPTIKNAKVDIEISNAKVMETTAAGLPQVSGALSVLHYPKIKNDPNLNSQKFVLENIPGSPFYVPPPAGKDNAPIAFGLQLANSLTGTLTATQLLFNGSYLVGLKSAKTYKELTAKQLKQAKIVLAEQVMKSYYSILVNEEKTKLLDLSISRLDSTNKETQALFKNGFVEKIDLDRLEVSLNNLKSEKQKTTRMLQLASYALKLQMGMPVRDSIQLTTRLDSVEADKILPANPTLDYSRRIEYSTLQTQKALVGLQMQNINAGYLPSLVGLATLGVNSAASKFQNLGNFGEKNRYAPYGYVGMSLNLPVFDGLQKKYQYHQSKLNLQKVDNGFKQLENAIDLEVNQGNINLANAQTNLEIQKRNLNLAQEVVRVSKIKYRQGVGSNLEVTNAESSLKESQTNYYSALYDFIIAKIDLDKAQGQLVTD